MLQSAGKVAALEGAVRYFRFGLQSFSTCGALTGSVNSIGLSNKALMLLKLFLLALSESHCMLQVTV
jgi:hypothetical protein